MLNNTNIINNMKRKLKHEYKKDVNGRWYWILKSGRFELCKSSEGDNYKTKADCVKSWNSTVSAIKEDRIVSEVK